MVPIIHCMYNLLCWQSESSVETLHRTIRSLEHKLGVAQGELGSTQAALAQSQQEYEQYKVSRQYCYIHTGTIDLIIHNIIQLSYDFTVLGESSQCVETEVIGPSSVGSQQ